MGTMNSSVKETNFPFLKHNEMYPINLLIHVVLWRHGFSAISKGGATTSS